MSTLDKTCFLPRILPYGDRLPLGILSFLFGRHTRAAAFRLLRLEGPRDAVPESP